MRDDEPTGQRATAWAVHGIPEDAQRMGLDRNTVEGSLVSLAGSLSAARRSHKLVAWVLLVVFAGPILLTLLDWLGG